MAVLHFDFTQGATRADIVRQLKERLGESTWVDLERQAEAAGVPEGHHHGIAEVNATIDALAVSEPVRAHLQSVYGILAAAESQVHGCPVEETHFHEVGEGARIRNTLLICLAFDACVADRVTATPVQTATHPIGSGGLRCKSRMRESASYSTSGSTSRTASNCAALARVPSTLPSCAAKCSKIETRCCVLLPSQ